MSLFIGNISKNVRKNDLFDEFERIGKCDINFKGSYAFVEYDNERDAEEAVEELQGKDMGGLKINIEWSKKSGRFSSKDSKRPMRQERSKDDVKCYNCNKNGHFARDCKERRRSRSRSGGRRNDRGRDRDYNRRRRSRSGGSRSRSESRRRDKRRDTNRDRDSRRLSSAESRDHERRGQRSFSPERRNHRSNDVNEEMKRSQSKSHSPRKASRDRSRSGPRANIDEK